MFSVEGGRGGGAVREREREREVTGISKSLIKQRMFVLFLILPDADITRYCRSFSF